MPARHPHTKYATRGYGIVGAALSAAGPADIFGRSAQAVRFEFSEWLVIVGLAISGVAIALVAYSLVTQRRGRLGKGFLLDSQGSPLKEIVFDPKCAVSLSEAKAKLPSGGLSGDEEAEVLGYRIKPIHAEKLHLILAYRGRSPPHHADYAAFLMGGVEERFDEALRGRDTEITERESSSVTREAHLQEEEGRIASRNAELESLAASLQETGVGLDERKLQVDASIHASEAKVAADLATIRATQEDVDNREAHLKEERWALAHDAEELEKLRSSVESRETAVSAREESVNEKAQVLDTREAELRPREADLMDRESSISVRESQVQEQGDALTAKALDLSKASADLKEREDRLAGERELLEKAREDLDPEIRAFEVRVGKFEEESSATRREVEAGAEAQVQIAKRIVPACKAGTRLSYHGVDSQIRDALR